MPEEVWAGGGNGGGDRSDGDRLDAMVATRVDVTYLRSTLQSPACTGGAVEPREPMRTRAPSDTGASQEEKAKYTRLLARLTPPPSVHEDYRCRVDGYLQMVAPALRVQQPGALTALKLRRSELFEGREYLVAYVSDEWLRGIAPGCDAVASPMAGPSAENDLGMQVPPLVFLPQSKRRTRSNEFRSIVEHEIVHINQALLGTFPELPVRGTAEELLDDLVASTAVEYEACFLQEVRWPSEHPAQAGVSLEHWCLLRGYTQALEHILLLVAQIDARPGDVERFLDLLASSLPAALGRVGADDDLGSWFRERLEGHLAVAMEHVMAPFPAVADHPAFLAAFEWLRPRLDDASRPRV